MYSAAFIFEPGHHPEQFDAMNTLIDEAARETDGFIGADTHYTDGQTRVNVTYYWESMEAVQAFSSHPKYREARLSSERQQPGMIVAEEISAHGDAMLDQFTLPAGR